MDVTTRFSRNVLPVSAAPKPGAAPAPASHAGVPIVWAHTKAPRGDAFPRARGGTSRGPVVPCPSGMAGLRDVGDNLVPQQCWGLLRAAGWDALGCGCPSCSGECSSHGNAAGLDAGWALLYYCSSAARGTALPCFKQLITISAKHQAGGCCSPAWRDGHTNTTGWTGRQGGMDTQSSNPQSVHPLLAATFTNSWDPTRSQPLAGRDAMA